MYTKESGKTDKTEFRHFLDNQQYKTNGILRYERIFGQGYVSTGGFETTKVSYHGQFPYCISCNLCKLGSKAHDNSACMVSLGSGAGMAASWCHCTKCSDALLLTARLLDLIAMQVYQVTEQLAFKPACRLGLKFRKPCKDLQLLNSVKLHFSQLFPTKMCRCTAMLACLD